VLSDVNNLPYEGKFTMAGVTIENWVDLIRDKQGRVVGTMLSWKDVSEYVHLAESFESEVRAMAKAVANDCASLGDKADTMSRTAEEARRESGNVSDASQRSAHNVETVAAAAEELTAQLLSLGIPGCSKKLMFHSLLLSMRPLLCPNVSYNPPFVDGTMDGTGF
jgi:hypothetical protein